MTSAPSGTSSWGSSTRSLLDAVLAGEINPGRVFDFETDLEHVVDAYDAMDERRAIKGLLRVGAA
jgi:threonine dehydrogenase-like Zn-dependent dehydrogenase